MRRAIDDKIIVVTGASTGIGRAAARFLADRGATVILAARADPFLFDLQQQLAKHGGRAIAVPTDVSNYEQVQHLADTVLKRFGRIDVWINNAAQTLYGTVEHTDVSEFRHLMEVNYMGQVHGTKAVLPVMRRQGHGTIIHVGSVEGYWALPLQGAYAASKAAIIQFANAARQELRGSNIHVCTVLPASIDTPFFDNARSKEGFKPKPLPPYYDAADVARAIASCVERPRRQVLAGNAGRLLLLATQLAPGLLDTTLCRFAARVQLTDIPEPSHGHDNFAAPLKVPNPLDGGLRARHPLLFASSLGRLGLALIATLGAGALAIGVVRGTSTLPGK